MITRFESILDRLDRHAQERPDAPAYTFLQEGAGDPATLSFGQLRRLALAIAATLQERLPEGERAVMLYPPGLEFIPAFLGCLYAGVAAVPAYPPRRNQSAERVLGIAADCGARAVLTVGGVKPAIDALAAASPQLAKLEVLVTDEIGPRDLSEPRPMGAAADDLAFLQYTSGSTSAPKGVMVSHGNIMHNEKLIQEAFGHDRDTVVVGWLPLFHDMGLLGNTLQPLYLGTHCILMAPLAFLQRPLRWLQAISDFKATTSGGPTFAYDLCAAVAGKGGLPKGLDLSRWSLAYVGAEPVRARTLRNFARTFSKCGFKEEAFYPCFGLAESTLFVTGGVKSNAPVVQRLNSAELQKGRARRRLLPGRGSQELVGCGREPSDLLVRIVDPEAGAPVPDRTVGEIWVSGPSVAQGYFGRETLSRETFGARLEEDPERTFLRTGDLGYRDAQEFFVTGRLKDLIIIRGRNYYPQDIELAVELCHERVRTGCTAAFGIQIDGEEHLAIAAEINRHGPEDPRKGGDSPEVLAKIREAVAAEFGLQAARVALLRPHAIPRTSSGKIRRSTCRRLLETGRLDSLASV